MAGHQAEAWNRDRGQPVMYFGETRGRWNRQTVRIISIYRWANICSIKTPNLFVTSWFTVYGPVLPTRSPRRSSIVWWESGIGIKSDATQTLVLTTGRLSYPKQKSLIWLKQMLQLPARSRDKRPLGWKRLGGALLAFLAHCSTPAMRISTGPSAPSSMRTVPSVMTAQNLAGKAGQG